MRAWIWIVVALAACGSPTEPQLQTPTFKLSEEGQSQAMAGGGTPGACSLVQTTRSWECMWRLGAGTTVLAGSGWACSESLGMTCITGGAGSVYGINDWWNHEPTDEGPPVPSNPYHCLDCGFGDPGLQP